MVNAMILLLEYLLIVHVSSKVMGNWITIERSDSSLILVLLQICKKLRTNSTPLNVAPLLVDLVSKHAPYSNFTQSQQQVTFLTMCKTELN